jgi:hypothetical protein
VVQVEQLVVVAVPLLPMQLEVLEPQSADRRSDERLVGWGRQCEVAYPQSGHF